MNKDKLEEIFRKGGVKPVSREKLDDFDIFIGDGFSLAPHAAYFKFGIEPTDFPNGMYVTWWWLGKDEELYTGHPLFFDMHHNPEYSWETKKLARVNTAKLNAQEFLKTMDRNVTKH